MGLYLTRGQPTGIQCQDFLIEAVEPPLAFGHQLGRETAVPVAGHLNVALCRLGLGRLLALTITAVARTTPIACVRLIAEMRGQLGLQRALNEPFGQLPEQAMRA